MLVGNGCVYWGRSGYPRWNVNFTYGVYIHAIPSYPRNEIVYVPLYIGYVLSVAFFGSKILIT